uniref:Glucose-methanol-choline oxidoreductase N-terminal domain-containing protein n=1 Tax=Spumella elongata TaxID=89044 RepID=A0A7S3H9F6_9STRA
MRSLVLAAGAIHTPVLLMNSGIGSEEQLQAAGVDVKVDSPRVGRGLQDHIAVGLTFQTAASATSDFGSAYAFPQQWSTYTKAVHRAMQRDNSVLSTTNSGRNNKRKRSAEATSTSEISETSVSGASTSTSSTPSANTESFGLLGDNGISAGAFLASPYAADPKVPDIQITLFPAVTEPHFVALMNYKAKDEEVSFRNQILITIALLSPEARFQISLNETHPLEGTPSVRSVPAGHSENSVGPNAKVSTTTQRSLFHHPRHDKNKNFAPTTSNNHSDSASPNSDENSPAAKNDYNIVPGALTERDVQRLAWAVQRVRSIVRDMRLQDLSMLTEVSPGSLVGHRPSSTNGFGSGNGNSSDGAAKRKEEEDNDKELTEWVRENAFLQSNWVGSAAMGKSVSLSSSSLPSNNKNKQRRQRRTLREDLASSDAEADDKSDDDGDADHDVNEDTKENGMDDLVAGSSVVDEHLSVRNVLALKIADASVIPLAPSGNIQATVQAVAWRAADFILKTFD